MRSFNNSVKMVENKFKLYYFVQYLSVGIDAPYFALYLYSKNFTGSQIGLLLGSMPIAVMVLQPLWSYLSDFFNTRRKILIISYMAMAVSILGLGYSKTFLSVFVWCLIYSGFRAPLTPIGNAIVLDYLKSEGKPEGYGLLRLWGSFSFGISSLILGSFFIENILSSFAWILAGLYLLTAGVSFLLPERGKKFSYMLFEVLQFLPQNPNLIIYMLGCMFIGASLSIVMGYQAIHLNLLGSPPWLIGVVISLQAIIEIPLMLLVASLYRRVSLSSLILIGAIALPIRWLLYILIRNPIWIIPTQALHSIAIVSFMVVGVTFIDQQVSQKWRATSQGLISTSMNGVGSGIGLFLAGKVLDSYDVQSIWLLNLMIGILGAVLIIIALHRFRLSTKSII